ncbi:MAG TPA: cyclic pyranopterin monophosphate synthase MoaC [Dongiaceae bacterium]|jgi:cyclic pyranopterin phosphate synthase|nr:cyclic pyranopterin monophosphate synthase MoaC [Dongiaceae bacterium]
MKKLSHLDESGQARMVDVGAKPETARCARARGRITMQEDTAAMIASGAHRKGDVLAAARIAGIMGAKKTGDLIPLCHPLALDAVTVDFTVGKTYVDIEAQCSVTARTGIEMEALTAVTVAALTLYDMVKSVDKTMRIEAVRLTYKSGGKSGLFEAE